MNNQDIVSRFGGKEKIKDATKAQAIVEPRLQISREKLKRISNRSLERHLSAAKL